MNIDPGIITLAQTTFLQHLNDAINKIIPYAFNLLYIFTAIELTLLGLFWALQSTPAWGRVFFKVLKIGLIFFILQNYFWLLDTIVQSFGKLAGIIVHKSDLSSFVFNPTKIWQYGYDAGIYLLKAAASGSAFGLILIQTTLGIGILLVFGLFGIQLTVQIVAFYITAITTLILLPLGIFSPSRKIFDRGLQSILQAGVRLMVIVLITGIAVIIWDQMPIDDLTNPNLSININNFLGLFFGALLFLALAIYLPRTISATVGEISSGWHEETKSVASTTTVAVQNAATNLGNLQAAIAIETNLPSLSGTAPQPSSATPAAISITAPPASLLGSTLLTPNTAKNDRSISEATLNKLTQTLTKTLNSDFAKNT